MLSVLISGPSAARAGALDVYTPVFKEDGTLRTFVIAAES